MIDTISQEWRVEQSSEERNSWLSDILLPLWNSLGSEEAILSKNTDMVRGSSIPGRLGLDVSDPYERVWELLLINLFRSKIIL